MAVRTHDIALGGFGEDPFNAGATDHPGHADLFVAAIAMVEVHGARRKSTATIGAWNLPKFVEHLGMPDPSPPFSLEVLGRAGPRSIARSPLLLNPRPDPMTDSADDIAFRDLKEEAIP